jgi:hypothetical protein
METRTYKIEAYRKGFRLYVLGRENRWFNVGYFKTLEEAEKAKE